MYNIPMTPPPEILLQLLTSRVYSGKILMYTKLEVYNFLRLSCVYYTRSVKYKHKRTRKWLLKQLRTKRKTPRCKL